MSTNITAQHRHAFEALTSGDYDNFALFSCFVDGAPATAIVAVNPDGEDYVLTPLFVSVTEAMTLTDHDGREPEGLMTCQRLLARLDAAERLLARHSDATGGHGVEALWLDESARTNPHAVPDDRRQPSADPGCSGIPRRRFPTTALPSVDEARAQAARRREAVAEREQEQEQLAQQQAHAEAQRAALALKQAARRQAVKKEAAALAAQQRAERQALAVRQHQERAARKSAYLVAMRRVREERLRNRPTGLRRFSPVSPALR